jgi:DNA polymerase-1
MKAVLIDVMGIANRAFHSIGDMTRPDGTVVGTLAGIHRACIQLEIFCRTHTLAFCFDSRESLRREVYPTYKHKRRDVKDAESEDKKRARQTMYDQVDLLPKLLREAGCLNLFKLKGYEADDVIASAVRNDRESEFVIFSNDEDYHQLLESGRVTQRSSANYEEYTEEQFVKDYGIPPCQWPSVKAWAGCNSDNVEGIKGIGPKKAIQFLTGKFKDPTVFTDRIEIYNRNLPLVKLPYTGCPVVRVREQECRIDWSVIRSHIEPGFIHITGV